MTHKKARKKKLFHQYKPMKNTRIFKIVAVALMAVCISLCAFISVPSPVPFTMQSFGVYLALSLLGSKKGTASIALYIFLGAAGLPVFSHFGAGVGYLLSPTGGFITGFLLCGAVCIISDLIFKEKSNTALSLALGTLACYLAGTLWFMHSTGTDFAHSLLICILPFVIPDALKLILALQISKRLLRIKLFRQI